MTAQLSQLLDAARLRAGRRLDLMLAPTDLVALTASVLAGFTRTADAPITFHASVPSLVGAWDATRLERVVSNLVSNAIKYNRPGREIVVTVRQDRDDGLAVLAVRDSGIGIPAEDLPRIFGRFYRGHNATSREGEGLGLAAVRQIVEQHRGGVTVESAEGEGTTFTVTLPLDPLAKQSLLLTANAS